MALNAFGGPRVGRKVEADRAYGGGVSNVVSRLHELPEHRFDPGEPVVALTFDDGPGPSTAAVVDELAELDVSATFFVVGSVAASDPDRIRGLVAAGHTVGGHSWSHPRGDEVDDDALVDEAERTAALIVELTGRPAPFVRAPFRKVEIVRYDALLAGRGFTTVTWSVDPRDWACSDPVEIAQAVLDHLHHGAIVLLHDGGRPRPATVDALAPIVHGARLAGYRFVSL